MNHADVSNSDGNNKSLPRTTILLPRYTSHLGYQLGKTSVQTLRICCPQPPTIEAGSSSSGPSTHDASRCRPGCLMRCRRVVYALLLNHYLSLSQSQKSQMKVFEATAKAYETIRQPRIHWILGKIQPVREEGDEFLHGMCEGFRDVRFMCVSCPLLTSDSGLCCL